MAPLKGIKAPNIDIAALRVLHLVHEYLSFTKAAEILQVNQSAVSYTVEKLRETFHDPLFYRQGGGIVATRRCHDIVKTTSRLVSEFEELTQPNVFDPASADDEFTIACNFYERQIMMPFVVPALNRAAPGIQLRLMNATSQGLDQLKKGEADLLIGPAFSDAHDIYARKLRDEDYVCVMDKRHLLAKSQLSQQEYVGARHIVVVYGGGWRSPYLIRMEELGWSFHQALTVPSPAGLQNMIQGTDLIATVPRAIALSYGSSVHIAELPLRADFALHMVWTTRTHKSSLHMWMRDLISECVNSAL